MRTATLMHVRTLDRLRHADLGFDPRGIAVLQISPEMGRLSRLAAGAYFDEAVAAVEALPGVQSAGVAHVMPLDYGGSRTTVGIAGYTPAPDEDMELNFVRVSPGYFRTLGLSAREGRTFDERDHDGQPERIIVNESMARRFWPDGKAAGRFVRFDSRAPFNVEVIGVVPDAHYRMVREPSTPTFYVPLAQWPSDAGVLHVRVTGEPSTRLAELRRVVAAVNPAVPVIRAHTLPDQVERIRRVTQTLGHLSSLFVANDSSEIHMAKRHFSHVLEASHNHSGNPEEDDIGAGHESARRVELSARRLVHGFVRPEPRRKPRVEHIRILNPTCAWGFNLAAHFHVARYRT